MVSLNILISGIILKTLTNMTIPIQSCYRSKFWSGYSIFCAQAVKALDSLSRCTGSSEPLLLTDAIRTSKSHGLAHLTMGDSSKF